MYLVDCACTLRSYVIYSNKNRRRDSVIIRQGFVGKIVIHKLARMRLCTGTTTNAFSRGVDEQEVYVLDSLRARKTSQIVFCWMIVAVLSVSNLVNALR